MKKSEGPAPEPPVLTLLWALAPCFGPSASPPQIWKVPRYSSCFSTKLQDPQLLGMVLDQGQKDS